MESIMLRIAAVMGHWSCMGNWVIKRWLSKANAQAIMYFTDGCHLGGYTE